MNAPAAASAAPDTFDVIILGGGLAGLTLAMQLRLRTPDIRVLVLERRSHPVPVAIHKVGESTVEIGAHYFQHVLGLGEHLREKQLRKFGFRFFFSDGRRDFDAVTELGASRALAVSSWQIDRGIFENFLGQEVQRRGITFLDGSLIREVQLAEGRKDPHRVTWQTGSAPPQSANTRWVIDACGRAGLLKKKLGLARANRHEPHAVWFRIGTHIVPDEWSADPAWRTRCDEPRRWLSTNHLVGEGYWVWLIPLSSGSHSVGIVADPAYHALEQMNTFERAMDWLAVHQPRLWDDLDTQRDKLQDFAFFRHFSYDCAQVFSGQRWALTGEAGRFPDPFYSPGSDFIGISNTYITDLVARDRAGQPINGHAQLYEQMFRSFYDNTMALYQGQYGILGDPEVLPIKVFWDYAIYWGVLAQLFFHDGLTDLTAMGQLRDEVMHVQQLNVAVQDFLRAMSARSRKRNRAVMLDQVQLPWFVALNRSLDDRLDRAAFGRRLQASARLLRALATEIIERARVEFPGLDETALRAALGVAGGPIESSEPMLFAVMEEDAVAR